MDMCMFLQCLHEKRPSSKVSLVVPLMVVTYIKIDRYVELHHPIWFASGPQVWTSIARSWARAKRL